MHIFFRFALLLLHMGKKKKKTLFDQSLLTHDINDILRLLMLEALLASLVGYPSIHCLNIGNIIHTLLLQEIH